jgi:hypothetical protein
MNLNLTHYHFEEIIKAGYNLDMIYFLKLADEGIDVSALCGEVKMQMICQAVRRKGLLSEDFKVTLIGKSILGFLDEQGEPEAKLNKKVVETDTFDAWWKAYPGTDTFTHKGQTFTGSRGLRRQREDCKAKLISILEEGEYTIEEMIAALEFEVLQKKENSVKSKMNKLSFMQNSLTYLNQRTFESFIELVKQGIKIVEEPLNSGSVDI